MKKFIGAVALLASALISPAHADQNRQFEMCVSLVSTTKDFIDLKKTGAPLEEVITFVAHNVPQAEVRDGLYTTIFLAYFRDEEKPEEKFLKELFIDCLQNGEFL